MNDEVDELQSGKRDLTKDIAHYKNTLGFLGENVCITCLCLPPEIEKILMDAGFLRIYDFRRQELRKIKGIGIRRADIIQARIDEFLGISG
jgi:hypothetical protein